LQYTVTAKKKNKNLLAQNQDNLS